MAASPTTIKQRLQYREARVYDMLPGGAERMYICDNGH
jgi:hypothetical protein